MTSSELILHLQRVFFERDRYRALCSEAPERLRQMRQLAMAAGVPVLPWDTTPAPTVMVRCPFGDAFHESIHVEYYANIEVACIAEAFSVHFSAEFKSEVPNEVRLQPFLTVRSDRPIIRAMKPLEEIAAELRDRGWQRLSEQDLAAYCPGVLANRSLAVDSALNNDLRGWLDSDPWKDTPPDHIAPYLSAAAALYAPNAPERLFELAKRPPWIDEIEALLRGFGGTVEQLSPTPYPSISWTVDFGEVRNGGFHARFFTDLHISLIAPVWYYGDRFTLLAPHPESLQRELSGWMWGEIGYTKAQTAMREAFEAVLTARGYSHFEEVQLEYYVPGLPALADAATVPMMGELLFRDPLGIFPPAPRVEEEHVWRFIRHRVGRLDGK